MVPSDDDLIDWRDIFDRAGDVSRGGSLEYGSTWPSESYEINNIPEEIE